MALLQRACAPTPLAPEPSAPERPPQGGWYWNSNRLARAWLPLIGLEGLGLLDFYLAAADHRPGARARGWAAVTLDELARLTGWGRARLVRLNRLLTAAGLLEVRYEAVPGRGPAVQRARYRVIRTAGRPDAAALARLAPLAERDPALAARLRRYTAPAAAIPLEEDQAPAPERGPLPPPAAAPDDQTGAAPLGAPAAPAPVPPADRVPVSQRNRSEEEMQTAESTTTSGRARARGEEDEALATWAAANGRPASCLERQRLAQLASVAAPAAHAAGSSGWVWVAEAIGEAVEAGSAYVAPRRAARIIARWLAEGRVERPAPAVPVARGGPRARLPVERSWAARVAAARAAAEAPAFADPDDAPRPPAVPGGPAAAPVSESSAAPSWPAPAALPGLPARPAAALRAALAAAGLEGEAYLRGATLTGWEGPARLRVATLAPMPPAVAVRLAGPLGRGLSAVVGRPVSCALVPQARPAAALAPARGAPGEPPSARAAGRSSAAAGRASGAAG